MTVTCRAAAMDDLRAVQALYRQLNPEAIEPAPERAAEVMRQVLSNPCLQLLVAEVAGRVVATCYLNVIPNLGKGAQPYAVLENVVVDEAQRGRGFGQALVRFAVQRAWQQGCYKLMLQTGMKTAQTLAFYERCGFSGTDKLAFVARP